MLNLTIRFGEITAPLEAVTQIAYEPLNGISPARENGIVIEPVSVPFRLTTNGDLSSDAVIPDLLSKAIKLT
jgi:hypothetical protein